MNYFNIISEYLQKSPSIQCIPVKGKAPFIQEWQSLNVTDEVIDSWEERYLGIATGLGFRAGQYNIGFMDIDSNDIGQIYKIDEVMDLSNICCKKGMKGKTVFFRYIATPKKSKYNIYLRDGDKKPIVEFNFCSGQTVLPPSIHPDTGMPYTWVSQSLLEIDIEDLPIIDEERIEYLQTILRAPSLEEGLKLVPTGITGDGSGKWKTITSEASRLLHLGIDDASIAKTLIGIDRRLFQGNQFFFSSKIGKDLISKIDDFENALMWVSTYKNSIMRTDADLRKTLSNIVRVTESVQVHGDWHNITPLVTSKQAVEYPSHLYPLSCKDYCHELSRLSAMPPEAFMSAIMTTFSVVCQGKVYIHAKRDFVVHPTISTMIIAPSGSRKDTIFDGSLAPFRRLKDRDLKKLGEDFIENEKNTVMKLEENHRKKKKAVAESDEFLLKSLNEESIKLQSELVNMKNQNPMFTFESGTQEKLYKMMNENQNKGIFICIPEFVQMMGTLNKVGNESMRGFILKLLNGSVNETHSHQTIGGLNINTRRVYGCALVGVQTDTFSHEIRKMELGTVNDGLFQRFFLINVSPEIRMMEDSDEEINSYLIDNKFALLYDHDSEIHVGWDSEETKKAYFEYDFKLRQDSQYDSSAIRSFRSKYSGQSVKIAWIFAQLDSPPGVIVTKISKKYFLMAVEWLNWQSRCLDITWSNNNYSTSLRVCNSILDGIKSAQISEKNFFGDIIRSCKFSPTEVRGAIEMLIDNNYIRRTGDKYNFHPNI
jgi:hypothetical protein